MKRLFAAVLILALLLCGCDSQLQPGETEAGQSGGTTGPVDFARTDAELFTDRDLDDSYSETGSTLILLDETGASVTGAGASFSGSTVTITAGGTYILRGSLADGTILVNAPNEKPHLVLEGVSVHSTSTAALCILEADKVVVTLAGENSLSSDSFPENDENGVDAAIFSRQDLSFNGQGTLTVESPAGHGIVCKDDLVFTGGTFTVRAASHGLDANDSVRMTNVSLTVRAGKDGIHGENNEDSALGYVCFLAGTLDIEAEGDGISAGATLQISGGNVSILAGGGSENGENHSSDGWGGFPGGGMGGGPGGPGGGRPRSGTAAAAEESTSMKGLKAGTGLLISGGSIVIDSADDGIHSNASAFIQGGSMQIKTGDDGIHGEDTLSVNAGTIEITESYEGLEALHIAISGGEITLTADDDGLNAAGGVDGSGTGGRDQMFGRPGGFGGNSNGSIVIDGGMIHVTASGDGLDANGFLEINGGMVTVCGPNSGDTATLDYDSTATINGGTFIGTGAAGMAQTFSDHKQGVLAIRAGQGVAAGTVITVSDASGKQIISCQPELPFAVIIISTPELISGETYHLTVGESEADMEAT